jgi:copper chaperone CopZ
MNSKKMALLIAVFMFVPGLALADHHEGKKKEGAKVESTQADATGSENKAGKIIKVGVNGMVCDFCADGIKKNFGKEKAISKIDVNLSDKLVTLTLNAGQDIDDKKISEVLKGAGYEVVAINR